ncbi:hypothetical protein M427DRAFT_153074 [Gonapodya prolifera JEL478]|uniref:Sec20 C-terminal domain-containing protein n=1 Tax=Gonapodya prolifera (strain JEL478) TaxID=1344416 RepID=A0A139APL9_GONPJ|nr:hypothetical protein M427DRAFT_153074 [Gonapodya prolifera JEL478]|eukprot:KXS18701.1 hypothetical protein M427DRAFT_153074 [Gonapodya prolifera JEL478]
MQATIPLPRLQNPRATSPASSSSSRSHSPVSSAVRARQIVIPSTRLPRSFQTVVDNLVDSESTLKRELDVLAEADGITSLAQLQAAADRSRESISAFGDLIADAHKRAHDFARAAERESAVRSLDPYEDTVKQLHATLRRSIVSAKKRLDTSIESRRIDLLGPGRPSLFEPTAADTTTEEQADRASSNLTDALKSAADMLRAEVERSEELNRTLAASTSVLSSTRTAQSAISSEISTSRLLVTRLARRDTVERILVVVSFLIFLLAVSYVLGKRVGGGISGAWRAVKLVAGGVANVADGVGWVAATAVRGGNAVVEGQGMHDDTGHSHSHHEL